MHFDFLIAGDLGGDAATGVSVEDNMRSKQGRGIERISQQIQELFSSTFQPYPAASFAKQAALMEHVVAIDKKTHELNTRMGLEVKVRRSSRGAY